MCPVKYVGHSSADVEIPNAAYSLETILRILVRSVAGRGINADVMRYLGTTIVKNMGDPTRKTIITAQGWAS